MAGPPTTNKKKGNSIALISSVQDQLLPLLAAVHCSATTGSHNRYHDVYVRTTSNLNIQLPQPDRRTRRRSPDSSFPNASIHPAQVYLLYSPLRTASALAYPAAMAQQPTITAERLFPHAQVNQRTVHVTIARVRRMLKLTGIEFVEHHYKLTADAARERQSISRRRDVER
jgi:hypothetical protein